MKNRIEILIISLVLIFSMSTGCIFGDDDDDKERNNKKENEVIEIPATISYTESIKIFDHKIIWIGQTKNSGSNHNYQENLFMFDIEHEDFKQITSGDNDLSQYSINIHEDTIVWTDFIKNLTYVYSISTDNSNLIADYSNDIEMFGNKLVWLDHIYNQSIFVIYDIETNTKIEANNSDSSSHYSFYDNNIVYSERNKNDSTSIHLFNIDTKEDKVLISGVREVFDIKLYEDIIVWKGFYVNEGKTISNSKIHIFDIAKNKEIKTISIIDPFINVDFYDNKIVWPDRRDDTINIYLYDLNDDIEKKIPGSESSFNAVVSERYVVFITEDESIIGNNMLINIFDLQTNDILILQTE